MTSTTKSVNGLPEPVNSLKSGQKKGMYLFTDTSLC